MKKFRKITRTLFAATGVVLFWRGTWGLMDLYIHPADPLVSYIISIVVGLLILSSIKGLMDELV